MGLQPVCQIVEAAVVCGRTWKPFDIVCDLIPFRMIFLRPGKWRGFVLSLALYDQRIEIYHLKVIAQSLEHRCCLSG